MRLPSPASTLRRRALPWLATLLLLAGATLAHAQSTADAAPPDRVARLAYISGDLGLLPAGGRNWGDADINRPLTTGDKLSTANDSRAELELGGGTLRMAGNTDFGMLNLSDSIAQVELTRGTLNLAVRRLDQGQSYEIDTPTLALVVTQPGNFRIDVDSDGHGTQVTVFDGQATVYGENNAQRDVLAGRHYQFDDASLGALMITEIQGEDAFDAWCDARNQRYERSRTRRYVSADMVGAQDLDQYGDWQTTAEYGAVWYPRAMPVGWAPYRYGHWAWIAPWGWTWVDASPWGFAPYHYGRWAVIGGAWGWVPGPIFVRPVYAPALVAFVGGGGWSVGIGIGAAPVGWFPLGPGEIYNPWYHVDRGYYQRVNITNIYVHNTYNRTVVINNIDRQYNDYRSGRMPPDRRYANRGNAHGFTAMPGKDFASGQRVERDQMRIDPRQLTAAPVLAHGVTAVRPTPASFTPARNPRARPLPVADFHRDVVARTPPPAALAATRAPFAPAAIRPAGAPAARPFTNVRVLNPRATGREDANAMDASARPGRPMPPPAAEAARPTAQPPVAPARASRLPGETAVPLSPGALPSSRFAHPDELPRGMRMRRADAAAPAPAPQRAGNLEHPAPAMNDRAPAPAQLPQGPRIERATPAENSADAARYPSPRYDAPRPQHESMQDQRAFRTPRQTDPQGEPNYPRPESVAPRNAASRYESPRFQEPPQKAAPRNEAPRFQQPRQEAAPRYEAPRFQQPPQNAPPREAPHPAAQPRRHAEPAPRKVNPKQDEQQR
ncbi:MAG: hypothetical protein EPN56_05495 [Rhodanobacter sp.]|nr:MAG: hypothetical protein EPN78_01320 [Rhodanobacter sp.]TAM15101.1 MAG: hypothetical protein EPN66_00690 [Rhodanobacter sp.]TAM36429.1 MAG: hypothetical protein EPN56_05495 [Rhodanobacter sp.]